MRTGTLYILVLAGLFLASGIYMWSHTTMHNSRIAEIESEYRAALDKYKAENLYYAPENIVHQIRIRQNPAGYFVTNPDLIFEPSEMNKGTMKDTRFAVVVLDTLGSIHVINRRAVIKYVMSNYVDGVKFSRASSGKKYAGFRTMPGSVPGVRTTMDALMVLERLGAMEEPGLDLERVRNFILAHQNPDGGFWDEDYPDDGTASTLKCTAFAIGALGRMNQHRDEEFDVAFKSSVVNFVGNCLDQSSGDYSERPAGVSTDAYGIFRAFITLWWLGSNNDAERTAFVRRSLDIDRIVEHLFEKHHVPETGGFTRFEEGKASLKATHLMVWFLSDIGEGARLDRGSLIRYAVQQENTPGKYGTDIYSTYAAVLMLKRLGASTTPIVPPEKPDISGPGYPGHLHTVFIVLGLIAIVTSYLVQRRGREMGESEERFRNLMESVPVGIGITKPNGRMDAANSTLLQMLGYERNEFLKLPVSTHYNDQGDRQKLLDLVSKGIAREFEVLLKRKDGSKFWASLTTDRHKTGSGSHLITAVQDISERKKIEEELLRTKRLESLGTLAAGVAHEINNPINSIINYAQMLSDKNDANKSDRDISDRIIKEGDRISAIVKGLLSFAREDKESKSPVDVRALLFDTLILTEAQMKKDGVILKKDVPQGLPEIIVQSQQIQQVFLNIINNAWYALNQKYPEAHADKTFEIIAEEATVNGDMFVRISFTDSGAGIPAEMLDKVMNPFFTTKPSGMGLGLSISHGIVVNHKGMLTIESREGEYTKVIVSLPAAKVRQARG